MITSKTYLFFIAVAVMALHPPFTAQAVTPTIEWSRQLGSSEHDFSRGVSVDSSENIFISGYTKGSLDGSNAGNDDAFLSKYNSSGTLQWTKQLGTSMLDRSYGVSNDAAGNAYITGTTGGDLDSGNFGIRDAYISKYNSAGVLQ